MEKNWSMMDPTLISDSNNSKKNAEIHKKTKAITQQNTYIRRCFMKETLLTNSELANFTSQMALILQAGISLMKALVSWWKIAIMTKTKQFLSSIEELLNQGETLYTSLQHTNAFSCLCFAYDSNR